MSWKKGKTLLADDGCERLIARLAARQYGHVTRRQLLDLGLGRGAIDHRIKLGRLIAVHAGVYGVGAPRTDPPAQAMAAVLAGGGTALLSHSSAAFLWDLTKRWELPAEITVTDRRRRSGIRVHSSATLTRRDIRRHLGLRVTSPARTLLDHAPRLTDRALTRAVNDALHSPYMRHADLAELLVRRPEHPGAGRLRPFVQQARGPTRSEFEDRFVPAAARYGLPPDYEINVKVAGWLVDVVFPAQKLIVELDGYEFHGDRSAFERDRERDAATLAAGYATVRVTWDRLVHDTDREMARLKSILAARQQLD